jgi:hypothetical protein
MGDFHYWCPQCGNRKTTDTGERPNCGKCTVNPVMKAQGRVDSRKSMPHPTQPFGDDGDDVDRFKPNEIVKCLLDAGPVDMNHLAARDFTDEDRAQFAQLVGYSLSGFSELSYVDNATYERATRTGTSGDTCRSCRGERTEVVYVGELEMAVPCDACNGTGHVPKPDPRDARVAELEASLSACSSANDEGCELLTEARARIAELEAMLKAATEVRAPLAGIDATIEHGRAMVAGARIDELEAALRDAMIALARDRTGLGKALADIVVRAKSSAWVAEGRGSYEWDDDEYRKETRRMLDAIIGIAEPALRASGQAASAGVVAAERALRGAT